MPRFASDTRSWILERLVLESLGWNPDMSSVGKEALTVRGDEVRHLAALPDVSVKPQTAGHGVDHPFAARAEFAEERLRRFRLRLDVFSTRHA